MSQVCDLLSEELTLVETQFHSLLVQCREDLIEILQVFFLRPSGDDHGVQARSHICNARNQDCRLISGKWPVLVPGREAK